MITLTGQVLNVSPDGVLPWFVGLGDSAVLARRVVEAIRMKIMRRSFYAIGQTTATPLDIANNVCVHDATLPKWRTERPDFNPDGQPCYRPVDLEALRKIVDPLKDEAFIQKTIRLNDTVVIAWVHVCRLRKVECASERYRIRRRL